LPVSFTLGSPGRPALIEAAVFLGICETICIPVNAQLSLDPASDPDDPADAAVVQAALAALPGPERPDFRASIVSMDDSTLLVEARLPGDPKAAAFFIAGEDGYSFA